MSMNSIVRRLLHLSDLHFGRVDELLLSPLGAVIRSIKVDLVIISGDFTQRARRAQFEAARKFLDSLQVPTLVVPGNHDIPLYKLWRRFFRPFGHYQKYISGDLEPTFIDDEVAVLGMNTVSLWKVEGAYGDRRLHKLATKFASLPPHVLKILVTHHPVPVKTLFNRKLGFDVQLAGHLHRAGHGVAENYRGYLAIQAGTSTSTRRRDGENNSFNLLEVDGTELKVQRYEWEASPPVFTMRGESRFRLTPEGWQALESAGGAT